MRKVILKGYILVPEDDLGPVRAALPHHVVKTRAEEGCITFQVSQDAENPCRFDVYEEFRDQAAFDHHQLRTASSPWAIVSANAKRYYQIEEG